MYRLIMMEINVYMASTVHRFLCSKPKPQINLRSCVRSAENSDNSQNQSRKHSLNISQNPGIIKFDKNQI